MSQFVITNTISQIVFQSKSFTPADKLIYLAISQLSSKEGYCWASNPYLAGFYGLSTRKVSESISKLSSAGIVITYVDNGYKRKIYAPYAKWTTPLDRTVLPPSPSGPSPRNVRSIDSIYSSIYKKEPFLENTQPQDWKTQTLTLIGSNGRCYTVGTDGASLI